MASERTYVALSVQCSELCDAHGLTHGEATGLFAGLFAGAAAASGYTREQFVALASHAFDQLLLSPPEEVSRITTIAREVSQKS